MSWAVRPDVEGLMAGERDELHGLVQASCYMFQVEEADLHQVKLSGSFCKDSSLDSLILGR